ncbi:MAG: type VI secretion system-associated FHA domain protein TagH [Gammaproteobacteria bacterium]|nr:type VI secretion system-associated FHA domain protein TagH [Gammaproteobacteria bacterium]
MPLQLKIISNHRDLVGDDYVRQFDQQGGTIGRALDNDWILPDPDRFISGRHATVDYQAGAFYLADTSSNGVYMNGEMEPVGNGNPRRLFTGDQIRMGDFEFEVYVDEGEDLDLPPPEPMTVVPDHIEQLVDEEALRTGVELLEEDALTGDEAFQSTLFGGSANGSAPRSAAARGKVADRIRKASNPFAAPKSRKGRRTSSDQLLKTFLKAAGINRSDIHPSADPNEIMRNAGGLLRELVAGVTALLKSRANVKSAFRLDQTTIMPRQNNPLKLAQNPADALGQLLVGKTGEYLSPLASVREVNRDLQFHQEALFEGMVAAFCDFVDRFDPDELEENFDETLDRRPMFAALNQRKYWQLYKEVYPIMTQAGSGRFPHHFGEDFVRAYEKLVADYMRVDEGNDDVAQRRTVKMQKPAEDTEDPDMNQEEHIEY